MTAQGADTAAVGGVVGLQRSRRYASCLEAVEPRSPLNLAIPALVVKGDVLQTW